MKNSLKRILTALTAVASCAMLTISAFAEDGEIRYPLTPTVTPLRIFFAVLAVIGFVVLEIVFEKLREKRVEKRNKNYEKDNK